MAQTQNDPKWTNEVKIAGVLGQQQVTPTFTKQVLIIRAKDTKDQQWKNAEIEIYIKPDLIQQSGAAVGDTILLNGWLAFNFWNDRSFPRIVATEIQVLEKANANASQPQPQNTQFNQPQVAGEMPQPTTVAPDNGPAIPDIPNVPPMP